MGFGYTLMMVFTVVFGTLAALFVFRNVATPAVVYIYNYFLHGQEKAEKEALDSMGENKASYAMKDALTQDAGLELLGVKKVQEGLADTAGGLVGKGGVAEGVGDAASDGGDKLVGGLGGS